MVWQKMFHKLTEKNWFNQLLTIFRDSLNEKYINYDNTNTFLNS